MAVQMLPFDAWREDDEPGPYRNIILLDEPADTLVTIKVLSKAAEDFIAFARECARTGNPKPHVLFTEEQVVSREKRPWHAYRGGNQIARND